MEKYGIEVVQSSAAASPPTWIEYLQDLSHTWSTTSAAVVIVIPWSVVVAYAVYYWFFKRPAKQERAALGPFLTFYTLLTDGATAGFDTQLMAVFHPALLKDGNVEKGLLRAMARCLTDVLGPVERVPRETVALKRNGLQVNCVALVDFAKKKQVKCQLSWIRRLPSVKGLALQEKEGLVPPGGRRFSPAEVVDDIGMAPLGTFHVTSFQVDQHKSSALSKQLDVLKYLKVEEFQYFAESFVERLLQRPPIDAVRMMLPALQEKHLKDGGKALEESVQKVVRAAGGLANAGIATLTQQSVIKAPPPAETEDSAPNERRQQDTLTSIQGIHMTFFVDGRTRNMEVEVRFTFIGMRCFVIKYELRLLPDQRAQIIVDHSTGSVSIVQ